MFVTEQAFRALLLKNPDLCAAGVAGPDLCRELRLDFPEQRRQLESAYAEFAHCCDWLLDSTPLKHVSCMAPNSSHLTAHIARRTGTPVSNGALIAAAFFLRLPHQRHAASADIKVGISLRSPTLAEEAV